MLPTVLKSLIEVYNFIERFYQHREIKVINQVFKNKNELFVFYALLGRCDNKNDNWKIVTIFDEPYHSRAFLGLIALCCFKNGTVFTEADVPILKYYLLHWKDSVWQNYGLIQFRRASEDAKSEILSLVNGPFPNTSLFIDVGYNSKIDGKYVIKFHLKERSHDYADQINLILLKRNAASAYEEMKKRINTKKPNAFVDFTRHLF
jgi:hypothetical protein